MRRRDLLSGVVAGAALVPFGATAGPSVPIIGYFSSRSLLAEAPLQTGFLDRLKQAGFVVGQNVAIEYRFAEGQYDRLPAIAAELVRLPAAALVATEPNAAIVAKKTTTTIPIVFASGLDPVRLGLVSSFSRPVGNATGMAVLVTELMPKRLELLQELVPGNSQVAFIADPQTQSAAVQGEAEKAAQALGLPILILRGHSEDQIEAAFATMAERRVRGLVFGTSTNFQVIAGKLVALAARYSIPAIYEWPEFVAAGGLLSYSTNRREIGRLIGDYVGRILRGVAPADLPVVQSTGFELVINLKTAKALGLTIPQSLLARADEVIE